MAFSWSLVVVNAATWFNFFSSAYIRMPNPKKNKKGKQKTIEKTARKELEKLEMKKQLEKEQQEKN